MNDNAGDTAMHVAVTLRSDRHHEACATNLVVVEVPAVENSVAIIMGTLRSAIIATVAVLLAGVV